MYTFVTSLNKAYWNSTSKININSWVECLPEDVNIVIYSEEEIDIGIFPEPRVSLKPLYDCKPLLEFINKHKDDPHYNGQIGRKLEGSSKSFKWKGIKFAHKTFAIFEEAKHLNKGKLFWLDADVLMHNKIDHEYLDYLLPNTKAISYLGRPKEYDECGLMGYNLDNTFAKDFLKRYENEYTGGLEHLRETHDSWIFFQLRLGYEDQTPFLNLNPTPKDNKSPFNNSGINSHMVHTKGKSKERLQQKFLKRFALQKAREQRELVNGT
tara:strand:- start:10587 stop:11387 length:801 start_codon:yes stop_codon:yes gene_type:complete